MSLSLFLMPTEIRLHGVKTRKSGNLSGGWASRLTKSRRCAFRVYTLPCKSLYLSLHAARRTYNGDDEKDDFPWGRKSVHVSLHQMNLYECLSIRDLFSKWLQVFRARDEYVISDISRVHHLFTILYLIELVLSVLLESFIFSPGTQEIEWVMRGIAAPITKNSLDAKRTMPLKVALVRDPSKI